MTTSSRHLVEVLLLRSPVLPKGVVLAAGPLMRGVLRLRGPVKLAQCCIPGSGSRQEAASVSDPELGRRI